MTMTTDAAITVAVCALSLMCLAACGNTALQVNGEIARAMLEVQSSSGPVIRELRVNASIQSARDVHDSGGNEAAAQAAAENTARSWQCAIDGHGIFATAVSAYVDTLSLWNAGQDFALSSVLPYVMRAVEAYRFLASCMTSLGSDALPEVPAFMNLIPSTWAANDAE